MKSHANLLYTAMLLALAYEGWQETIGDVLAHTIGASKSILGLAAATLITYLWSLFYEHPDHKRPPTTKPKARRRPGK